MTTPGSATATSAFLAAFRATRVEPVTTRLVETILQQNAGYDGAIVSTQDLEHSCRTNVARVLELLTVSAASDPVDYGDHYFDAARETGRRRAEQGVPLDAILRSYRQGGRLIWEDLHQQASLDHDIDADAVRELGTRLWYAVDATSAQVAAAYHATENALVRADEQRRASLWEGLFGGRAQDPAFAQEATRLLDLPVDQPLLVVVLEHADTAAADELAERLESAGARSCFTRRTDGAAGIVAGPPVALAVAVATIRSLGRHPAGVSAVLPTIADAEAGYRQATTALRTLAGTGGVAVFDERLPDALLLAAPEVTRRLVDVGLGAVLALPESESRLLLEALQAWVATNASAARTAEMLHCHRNTVGNRIRRLSHLTGADLTESVPLTVVLALHALRLRDV